jgi:hypothetical protein
MDIIEIGVAVLLLGGIGVGAVLALFKTLDDKFPPVKFDVYDRGVKMHRTFRLWGDTIVANSIFRLLLNDFTIMGDLKAMEFDMVDSQGFLGFGGGLSRRYRAYRRHDYLFAIKKVTLVSQQNPKGVEVIETEKIHPQIVVESFDGKVNNKVKVRINADGILVPLQILRLNESLSEFEVSNGKAIASRFIDNQKSNKLYLEATNPVVNNLLYSLPLIAIVLANGVVLYLVSNTVLGKLVEVSALLSRVGCQ